MLPWAQEEPSSFTSDSTKRAKSNRHTLRAERSRKKCETLHERMLA